MRSQIACVKCRTSKVRCTNNGPGTTCHACAKVKRVCTYPLQSVNGTGSGISKRRESAAQNGPTGRSGEANSKKRKIAPFTNAIKDGSPGSYNLLSPQLFTRQVLDELFAIFEQHFATDLPFLHAESFTEQLRQADVRSLVDPFASLFLAFLALTAHFHDTFVQHHWHGSTGRRTPVEISEQYAEAARARLVTSNAYIKPNLQTTQALLMLGLHEWRSRQGQRCFLTIGSAINCAEMLGCHEQHDLDDAEEMWPPAQNPKIEPQQTEPPTEDQSIIAEVKRRTYWCCFILDSYVSSGERRRQKVRIDEIKIQLPCSQRAFDLGLNVKTMMLDEDSKRFNDRRSRYSHSHQNDCDVEVEWEDEHRQEALAWFIKALVVYRGVMDWVCNITRRKAKRWPWDPNSKFCELKKKLEKLKKDLHRDLVLDDKRTRYHIRNRTSRSYVQLHSILALCDMALHREYIAYLPWDQPKPAGPVDGPELPPLPPGQESYWEHNAHSCFKATREFNDLMATCKEEGVLVETSIVGFAMFYVMQIGLWCRFFPQQDQNNYLCTSGGRDDKVLGDNIRKAGAVLHHMYERLPMSQFWARSALRYLNGLKKLQKERRGTGASPESNSSNSTAGSHDGLMLWVQIEKELKEFQSLKDEDNDADNQSVPDVRHYDASEPSSPNAIKSENEETNETTPETVSHPAASWATVNDNRSQGAGTPKPIDKHTSTPVAGQYHQTFSNGIYGHTFVSPSNGAQLLHTPTTYHPAESKVRDTLNEPTHSQTMADIAAPSMSQYTSMHDPLQPSMSYPEMAGDLAPLLWQRFATGYEVPDGAQQVQWPVPQGLYDHYGNAGNNAIQ